MKRTKLIPALMALAVLSGCGDSISENTGEPAATLQEQQTVSQKQTESTPDEPEVTRQTTTSAPAEPEPETTTTKKTRQLTLENSIFIVVHIGGKEGTTL